MYSIAKKYSTAKKYSKSIQTTTHKLPSNTHDFISNFCMNSAISTNTPKFIPTNTHTKLIQTIYSTDAHDSLATNFKLS